MVRVDIFNNIPIGTVFYHRNYPNDKYVKIANAIPNFPLHKQPPNAVRLANHHYITMSSRAEVFIDKTPYDDKYIDNKG